MRFGVKYCGGCNPRYNRSEIVEKLKKDFPDAVITSTTIEHDYSIIIAGCNVACVHHDQVHGVKGKILVKSEKDYEILLKIIKADNKK